MPVDLRKFDKLKREVETARQQKDRAEGALQQAMKQLKDEMGCDSLDEARELEKKLSRQVKKAEADFESELEAFEEKWGEIVG
jgi:predicted  nucleic acid-binding Zn-ribbon protein